MDYKKVFVVFLLGLILSGCVAVVGGAAIGATSAIVVYDQRNVKTIINDERISRKIVKQLEAHPNIVKQCHIEISTYRGIVLLAGQAPNTELKAEIEDIVRSVDHVKRFYNEMTVQGPSSSLTRTSDTWITTKAKAELLGAENLKSGQFKVVTENGTVFLMGLVTHEQADLAVETIRKINGVQRVVKIFEYKH